MAATVVSVVIFLCGVLVGRGVRAERAASLTEPTTASIEPTPRAYREVQDEARSGNGCRAAAERRAVQAVDHALKLLVTAALVFTTSVASAQTVSIKLASIVPENSIWDKNLKQMGAEWSQETG